MPGTLGWVSLLTAAFFFGIAATIKLFTWILVRNSAYDGGESCLGNFISTIVTLIGIYLIYLSLNGF